MSALNFTTSRRGNMTLQYRDNTFYKHVVRKNNETIWRCKRYNTKCKAVIKIDSRGRIISSNNSHNHDMGIAYFYFIQIY